jgi:hypothetical protein
MSTFVKAAAVAATVLVALSVVPVAEFAHAAQPPRGVRYLADDARPRTAFARPGE